MSITREEAWEKLSEWTQTDSLRKHARAVELVMREAAHRYGNGADDVERWGIAGMLHDADYEQWPEEHPQRIVAWLRDRGEEEIGYAISAHYTQWNVPHRSPLDRALLACDELTGFVVACCLVRPEGVHTLGSKRTRHSPRRSSAMRCRPAPSCSASSWPSTSTSSSVRSDPTPVSSASEAAGPDPTGSVPLRAW
jgi:hypothetical protein